MQQPTGTTVEVELDALKSLVVRLNAAKKAEQDLQEEIERNANDAGLLKEELGYIALAIAALGGL